MRHLAFVSLCLVACGGTQSPSPDHPPAAGSDPGTASPAKARAGGRAALEKGLEAARNGDLAQAVAHARAAIEANPKEERAYLLLGSSCAMQNDEACAFEAYERGAEALPSSAPLLNERGLSRLARDERDAAVQDLERAVELSRDEEPKFLADLAYAYLFVKRADEAEALALKATKLDPKCFDCQLAVGEVMLRKKNGLEAVAAYTRALAIVPDDQQATVQLATAHRIAGQNDDAYAIYVKLLERDEGNARLNVMAADALMAAKKPKKAILHLEKALGQHPDHPDLLERLLEAQKAAGDKQAAKQTQKRLEKLGDEKR